jgi:hypothetical protein
MKLNQLFKKVIALVLVVSCSCNKNIESETLLESIEMEDFEILLESTFPFIKKMLSEHGEFYPLASAIDKNDKIVSIGSSDGTEMPNSNDLFLLLKKAFKEDAINGKYKSIAIFYDVEVTDPNTNEKSNAIAVFLENKNDKSAYNFFYTYILTNDGNIEFKESWRNEVEKEIFVD